MREGYFREDKILYPVVVVYIYIYINKDGRVPRRAQREEREATL